MRHLTLAILALGWLGVVLAQSAGADSYTRYELLDPASAKACDGGAPMLSLFQDSRITMPDFARLTHGGQLYDLVDDGFPYGEEPAAVMVSARDPAALGAAWTLLGKLAQAQVLVALLESAAAEQAARMTAMDAATRNSAEMIDGLTLTMNKIRQAAITREIIEVVSGAQS